MVSVAVVVSCVVGGEGGEVMVRVIVGVVVWVVVEVVRGEGGVQKIICSLLPLLPYSILNWMRT